MLQDDPRRSGKGARPRGEKVVFYPEHWLILAIVVASYVLAGLAFF